MARIRTIKPQFWTDEKIASLSRGARLMFIGIWNFADDDGLIIWRPEYLKSMIFPYDTDSLEDIGTFMIELSKSKLMRPYKSRRGDKYAQVVNFPKHQRINRPQPSHIPHPRRTQSFTFRDTEQPLQYPPNDGKTDINPSLNHHGVDDNSITDDSLPEGEGGGRSKEYRVRSKEEEPPKAPLKGGQRRLRYTLKNMDTDEQITVRADSVADALSQSPWYKSKTIPSKLPR